MVRSPSQSDKNYDIPYGPDQLHEWIGSVDPQFHMLHVNTKDEGAFGVLNVNVFSDEADNSIHIQLP